MLLSRFLRRTLGFFQTALLRSTSNTLRNQSPSAVRVRLNLNGTGNTIHIAPHSKGCLNVRIRGDGNQVQIGTGARFDEPNLVVEMQCDNSILQIGAGTTSQGSTFQFRENGTSIIVGDDCMLGGATEFWVTDFHSILDLQTGRRTNLARQIELENHVWIGWGAKILKNVQIGKGAVVSVGSVVTRDVAPHTIVFGVPAAKIKSNIDWHRDLL